MIAVRWTRRLGGLISTIILARLLTPADYGIVTIAMMLVGAIEVFGYAGQNTAIIRHPNPTREHYDAAWTISLLLALSLGVVIWLMSPLAALYFHEPRATLVVQVLAFRMTLEGAQNIAIVNLQRNLQFHRQFIFSTVPSLASLAITISAAFFLRNYWALVIGIMSQYLVALVMSYAMDSFRPRLGFRKIRELLSFSVWSLFGNLGTYFATVMDRLAISGFAGSAGMGRYYVASDIATAPTTELTGPYSNALLPVIARVQHDRAKLRDLCLTGLYGAALICTSSAVGVALVADDMVDLVLGPQWSDIKPLMPWLALAAGLTGMTSSLYAALYSIGQAKVASVMLWLRLAIVALAVFSAAQYFRDVEIVAVTRLIATILIVPTFLIGLRPLGLSTRDLVASVWRPLLAAGFMAVVVLGTNASVAISGTIRLAVDVAVGSLAYTGALLAMWLLLGRPDGPERIVWSKLRFWMRPRIFVGHVHEE